MTIDGAAPRAPHHQRLLLICSSRLANFRSHTAVDGRIPLYGFGCKQSAGHSVFPFHSSHGALCVGIEDVLKTYAAVIPTVTLAGPTSFAPIIDKAVEHVKQDFEFTLLMILADGQVTAVKETEDAIIAASKYPLSIVCIGEYAAYLVRCPRCCMAGVAEAVIGPTGVAVRSCDPY